MSPSQMQLADTNLTLSAEEPARLELDKVSVAYGQRQALCDISIHIPPGQCVAVVGPNGAGK